MHFQFSLWDSLKYKNFWSSSIPSFNSLYEIRSNNSITWVRKKRGLSILFMRFVNVNVLVCVFVTGDAFNSLYEIRQFLNTVQKQFKLLSILFMRFIEILNFFDQIDEIFQFSLWDSLNSFMFNHTWPIWSFNSLYEIRDGLYTTPL